MSLHFEIQNSDYLLKVSELKFKWFVVDIRIPAKIADNLSSYQLQEVQIFAQRHHLEENHNISIIQCK